MAEAKLKAEVREATGKQGAKNLRRQGLVPGIFYGMHKEPVSLSIDGKELSDLLHSFGRNMVVNLTVVPIRRRSRRLSMKFSTNRSPAISFMSISNTSPSKRKFM